ncbi:class I SAM-dependent DNA methyltransferase [Rubrivivax sp. A210]|uniref:class I SAM-dependent DNA methyltransferase n=1 Tax=Rubrivivax sp. A210 TaxID=2772301 RepID=UPI0019193621|nr:class I SAM-dependent methyltransferase [Rubrivivax sp. A210]
MEEWKRRLYAGYVSTGQSTAQGGESGPFDARRHPQMMAWLRQVLPARRDLRILDLACGHGPLLLCAKALGCSRLAGVDVSAEQVALAHRAGLDEVVCQELSEYLAGHRGEFDLIFAMDVLEHLTKPELLECMDQVALALVPEGRLVIHVPNAEGLFGMRVRYGDLTHETAFTPQSISQLLRATGFTDIRCDEDRPQVHGLKSAVRRALWHGLTAPVRLLLAAETGCLGHVLSQNMLVQARKAGGTSGK